MRTCHGVVQLSEVQAQALLLVPSTRPQLAHDSGRAVRSKQGENMKVEVEFRARHEGDIFDIVIQNRILFCITETYGTVPKGEVMIAIDTHTCRARVLEFKPDKVFES